MYLHIFDKETELADKAAKYIVSAINNHKESRPFVLGLPTGNTPTLTYKKIIELYKQNKVSFKNVVTFNMDEYFGMKKEDPESFHYYMYSTLFDHIDIPRENINIPYTESENMEVNQDCEEYESKILSYGGIDLFVCGIGKNGHIAFNEPFSSFNSKTRVVKLDIDPAKPPFCRMNPVPTKAITVGVKTILAAKELLVLATGAEKKKAVATAIEGPLCHKSPISCTQMHPHVTYMIDLAAAGDLENHTIKYLKSVSIDESNKLLKL